MTEPARMEAQDPIPPSLGRPSLEIVGKRPVVTTDESNDEAGIGRTAAIGAVIGFLIAAIGITVAGALGGLEFGSSAGLGVFVGMWGGAGFGSMMGATIPYARRLDASHGARTNDHGQGDTDDPATR